MGNIHFNILINDIVERILRHTFNILQCLFQILNHSKLESGFGYIDGSYLPGEIIKASEKISMNLLQSFHRANLDIIDKAALKQSVCFRPTFAVNTLVAVGEPFHESGSLIVRETLRQSYDTVIVKHICEIAFPIRGKQFQLVSVTNQLVSIPAKLSFKILPVIAILCIIILCVEHTDNVKYREPPLCSRLVPDSPHFAVVKESYRYFLYLAHGLIMV